MVRGKSCWILGMCLTSAVYGNWPTAKKFKEEPKGKQLGTVQNNNASKIERKPSNLSYSLDASFLYWYAKEDGLNLAESAIINNSGIIFLASNGKILQSSFSYEPGFKVGMGIKGEDWGLEAEYTWFKSHQTTTAHAPGGTSSLGTPVWSVGSWFLQTGPLPTSLTGTQIASTWELHLNLVDLLASHPIGKTENVMVSGFVGVRTAWIHQDMNLALTEARASAGGSSYFPPQPIHSKNHSNSWGIGPKIGCDTHYLLPLGLRIEGLLAGSLLYTQFTDVGHYEDAATTLNSSSTDSLGRYISVRPVMELGLCLGWKRSWSQKYEVDVLASYDFSLFWGQNMMRQLLDESWSGISSSAGDLYFHGLTVTAGFRF